MLEPLCLSVIQGVIDTQHDLIVIFKDEAPIAINRAFGHFFDVGSLDEYYRHYGTFVEHFVPHPSYFHKEHIGESANWFDAIMARDEMDRVVSMMTPSFDPHAFAVTIQEEADQIRIVTFNDITQSLIKRIMIENNATIDVKSGAYAKEYFLHIAPSYEDAARFNEKIVATVVVDIQKDDGSDVSQDSQMLHDFVSHCDGSTRQDDMLVRWSSNRFLLVFLIDTPERGDIILQKLHSVAQHQHIEGLHCQFNMHIQKEGEPIKAMLSRMENSKKL